MRGTAIADGSHLSSMYGILTKLRGDEARNGKKASSGYEGSITKHLIVGWNMRDDIKINDRALALEEQLIETLESIYDPEIELDIYHLGLIYEINLDENGFCKVVMTFTDAGCSCSETLPGDLIDALKKIEGIDNAGVEVVWSPAWKMTRISRLGRITLGISPK